MATPSYRGAEIIGVDAELSLALTPTIEINFQDKKARVYLEGTFNAKIYYSIGGSSAEELLDETIYFIFPQPEEGEVLPAWFTW